MQTPRRNRKLHMLRHRPVSLPYVTPELSPLSHLGSYNLLVVFSFVLLVLCSIAPLLLLPCFCILRIFIRLSCSSRCCFFLSLMLAMYTFALLSNTSPSTIVPFYSLSLSLSFPLSVLLFSTRILVLLSVLFFLFLLSHLPSVMLGKPPAFRLPCT